jgi:hypothetical protein
VFTGAEPFHVAMGARSWLPTALALAALTVAVIGFLSAQRTQSDVDRLDDRLTALEEQVGEPAGLDDLDSRLSDLEDADLDGRLFELENADLDSRVTDVEQSVTDICDAVTNTNTNSAIQEVVDDISFACP